MERPVDIRIHRLQLAKSRAMAENPVDLPAVAEINLEIQRIQLGRKPQMLDPVTQGYIDTIKAQTRGRNRDGSSLFQK